MDQSAQVNHAGADRGSTLIEVLVALSILSIAGVAILAGVEMSIRTSDIHRKQGTGGAHVRNYAEALERKVANGGYVPCSSIDPDDDATGSYAPENVPGFAEPAGYDAYFVPPGAPAAEQPLVALGGTGSVIACAADSGVQLVRLVVKSDDSRATEELLIVLRKPCDSGATTC